MTGTAFTRLNGSGNKSASQRLRDRLVRAVRPYVTAIALSTIRLEPIAEPPKRKTKILFKRGEREALEAEAKEDERNGKFYEAGVKYAQVENAAKASEMADACRRVYDGERGEAASALIHERIEEYC